MTLTEQIIIGIAVMLLMAISIILFVVKYQRNVIIHELELRKLNEKKELELTQASIKGEEEERNRIATELHDDVGAMLASVRLYLRSSELKAIENHALSQARVLLDETVDKVRALSHRLQPSLKHIGLRNALCAYFEVLNKTGAIKIDYHLSNLAKTSDNAALAVYRIMQELINNTIN